MQVLNMLKSETFFNMRLFENSYFSAVFSGLNSGLSKTDFRLFILVEWDGAMLYLGLTGNSLRMGMETVFSAKAV